MNLSRIAAANRLTAQRTADADRRGRRLVDWPRVSGEDPFVDAVSVNWWSDPVDGRSELTVQGWHDQAEDASPAETVELLWRTAMDGSLGYSTLIHLLSALSSWAGVTIYSDVAWSGTGWPWEEVSSVAHQDLDFGGTTVGNSGGNLNHADVHLVKGDGVTNDQNTCNHVTALGRALNDLAIDLTSGALYDDASPNIVALAWLLRTLNFPSGSACLDWSAEGTLAILAGAIAEIQDTTDITPGTAATGALQLSGGLSVALAAQVLGTLYAIGGLQAPSDEAEQIWTEAAFKAQPTGDLTLAWGGSLYLQGDAWTTKALADLTETDIVLVKS